MIDKKVKEKLLKAFVQKPFQNPYHDSSDPKLWGEELTIIERVARGAELVQDRHYIEERQSYGIHWYWAIHPKYPSQWDGPVTRLIARGILRATQVGGGYTTMILSTDARAKLKKFGIKVGLT